MTRQLDFCAVFKASLRGAKRRGNPYNKLDCFTNVRNDKLRHAEFTSFCQNLLILWKMGPLGMVSASQDKPSPEFLQLASSLRILPSPRGRGDKLLHATPIKESTKSVPIYTGRATCIAHDKNLSSYRLNVLKTDKTPHPNPLPQGARGQKVAFTLAEVLITLGIIGVVAALTLPSLVQKYQKNKVEVKVAVFYSKMQEALQMAKNDYGDFSYWIFDKEIFGYIPDSSFIDADYKDNKKFVEKYIIPYFKDIESVQAPPTTSGGIGVEVHLLDGSVFVFKYQTYSNNKLALLNFYLDGDSSNRTSRNMFVFMLDDLRGLKAFDLLWDNKVSTLMNHQYWGCKNGVYGNRKNGLYCTKLLEINNWHLPKDYPW